MKTYNVALKQDIDYDEFWYEMETIGVGGVHVPKRAVAIVNERPTSLRQCWYELSDSEADLLRQDPRVYCVEIPPEHRTDIEIKTCTSQSGLYYKVSGTNPADTTGINWGLFRLGSTTNNTINSSGILNYNYNYDGTGVDFVLQDSGCQIDHPEFTDVFGSTRVQQINWYTASGVSGTMPAFNLFYSDYNGHGTHVCGIAAGKTYGRAKNARIYVMSVQGLTSGSTVGLPVTDVFDCVKGWHNNKPIDPATGYKRPTVVNMSWGYVGTFPYPGTGLSWTVNYRGTSYSYPAGSPLLPQYGMVGNASYRYSARVDGVDVDVQELLAAGVVLVGAAGNYYQTVDIPGGVDYDNCWGTGSTITTPYYYMRGMSPTACAGVICVGNVDSSYYSGTTEVKNGSSESGPRVDVWAPGTNIVSATSTVNAFGATAKYPYNANYRICSIGGTSMASPNIAGLVAQLLQQSPGATPAQIRQAVIDAATPNVLYTTGQSYDYTNSSSLHGGPNRYGYFPAGTTSTSCSVTGAMTVSGPLSITYT